MSEHLDMQSLNWANLNSQFIAERFPNCVTETADGIKIDFDLLKQELSADVIEGNKERYRLEWSGKKESIVTANLPTTKTLRPIREESVDFDNTENLYIEGDNLEVLKLLQESYLGKIKMIYIDPPYNTGKDFVYKDNFAKDANEELLESGQKDEYNQRLVVNPETSGRYHSDWLTMMYPRLKLARNLLSDDGVIFISIDDNELDNLKRICDEIFGEQNFISRFIHKNNSNKNQANLVSVSCEYFLCYSKNSDELKKQVWRLSKKGAKEVNDNYLKLKNQGLTNEEILSEIKDLYKRPKFAHLSRWNKIDDNGIFMDDNLSREGGARDYTIINPNTQKECPIPPRGWAKSKEELIKLQEKDLIYYGDPSTPPRIKSYLTGEDFSVPDSFWYIDNSIDTRWQKNEFGDIVFDNPKPLELLYNLIHMTLKENSCVLDFFSGSSTTAHAIMQVNAENNLGLQFILVQVPEAVDIKSYAFKKGFKNICEIGKERIRIASSKIKEAKLQKAKSEGISKDFIDTQDYGFRVYRLDESNMQDVYYKPQEYKQANLELFTDNVKPDRSADDLLAQVMLDWGLPLNLKIEQENIAGKLVFKVAGNSLFACFDKNIDEAFAKELAKESPLRIVFKDSGFKDDTAKTNVKQLLKQLSPNTEMKVL